MSETVRIVLLGASNLTRCLPAAVVLSRFIAAQNHPGLQVEILVACGRGRSYGQSSFLLGRALPGILQSGLWPALEQMPEGPTYALLTDIGNDVLYGVEPSRLVGWLDTCVDRLESERGTRFAVTALPLENLDRFPIAFLDIFRKVLFPSSALPATRLLERAEQVDEDLRELCCRRNLPLIEQPDGWFNVDPIHYSLRRRHDIWGRILSPWQKDSGEDLPRSSKLFYWQAWYRESTLFGRSLRRAQPSVTLKDGTPVSLF